MQNEMWSRSLGVLAVASLALACSTAYPSARLSGPECGATPEAMARVTYEDKGSCIELGCLGCAEVYRAAEMHWLGEHYPGFKVKAHQTVSSFPGSRACGDSCWDIVMPDGGERSVCFADSGWCKENRRGSRDSA